MSGVARVAMMVGLMLGMFSALASMQGITNKDILDGLANGARWLTHSGDYTGQRHSPLTQITPANVGQLAAQWTFQTGVLGKFEATPIVIDGTLYVMDEMLTPDSSRFWPAEEYRIGISPPSYDKQFVRDYLETLDWNKKAPGPRIPPQVIAGTADKYAQALWKLAGIRLS